MVTKGIVLGHIVSPNGIEVDPAKISVIQNLPLPKTQDHKRHPSFSRTCWFLPPFHKRLFQNDPPLTNLLAQDVVFNFDETCIHAFNCLKAALVSAPIIQSPDWSLPFELMCDASDYAVGAVLGQRRDKNPTVVYYASKTLNDAQRNYTTTEKEMLAVVFGLEKF